MADGSSDVEIVGKIRVDDQGSAAIERFNQGVGEGKEKLGLFGNIAEHVGKIVDFAIGGLVEKAVEKLGESLKNSAEAFSSWAEKLDSTSRALGTTTEQSATLAVAAQHVGANVEQVTASISMMARGLTTVDGKLGPTGKAVRDLGVSVDDATGKMRPTMDILHDIADKISAMPDGLEKTQIEMQVFGRSGRDMDEMLKTLAGGGMEDMSQMAQNLGLSLSKDSVEGAKQFGYSMNDLKMSLQGVWVQVGQALMPAMQGIVDILQILATNILPVVISAITPFAAVIVKIADFADEIVNDFYAWQDPLDGITVTIGKFFGLKAEMKFYDLAQKVKGVVTEVRDFLLPIFVKVKDFINNQVIPAILGLGVWFESHLPMAMAAVSGFWNGTLKPAVMDIAMWLGENIPLAFAAISNFWTNTLSPALTQFVTFIQANWQPIVAGLIAVIVTVVVPAFLSWAAGAIASAVATVAAAAASAAAMLPLIALVAVIGIAVALLYKAWTTNWHGIRTTLTEVWNDKIKPFLIELVNWLKVNIPLAIAAVKDWVENTLIPALKDIAKWINEHVIPALTDVANWLSSHVPDAINTVKGFLTNTLGPALYDVWDFLYNKVVPVLADVVDWIANKVSAAASGMATFWKNTLLPAITDIRDFINDHLIPAITDIITWFGSLITKIQEGIDGAIGALKGIFDGIKGAIQGAIDVIKDIIGFVQTLIDAITKIPDWLLPGSPTPFEVGIRGISNAMQPLNEQAKVFGGVMSGYPGSGGSAGNSNVNNNGHTFNFFGLGGNPSTRPGWFTSGNMDRLEKLAAGV